MNDKVSSFMLMKNNATKEFTNVTEITKMFEGVQPVIRISNPKNGDIWQKGETYTVIWTSQRASGGV